MTDSSSAGFELGWEQTLDRIIAETEAAELELSLHSTDAGARKETGSFYTPADVADHVWEQFFRVQGISKTDELRAFIDRTQLVEPSAGSGIFVFTFVRKALQKGLRPEELSAISYSIVDLNLNALRFVHQQLSEIEESVGTSLAGFHLIQDNFLSWLSNKSFTRVAFVGNPPFVTNAKGSRWRNLFADFVDGMLEAPAESKAIGLILPMSVCFSRDYEQLRQRIFAAEIGLSAASYDNIPDCLFKSGKPESGNSNKANSQRCTVLMLGGSDQSRREATPLIRWSARDREKVLATIPPFEPFPDYDFDGQIPRPSCRGIMDYLRQAQNGCKLADLLARSSEPEFNVGAVARNFIGIRDGASGDPSSIPISGAGPDNTMVLLQVLASPVFYEYWRSLGDGFHITLDLVTRFPVSDRLYTACMRHIESARAVWAKRDAYAREKLNSGKVVRSYDFRTEFNYLAAELNSRP